MNFFRYIFPFNYYLSFIPHILSFVGGYFIGIRMNGRGIKRATIIVISSLILSFIGICINLLFYFLQVRSLEIFKHLSESYYLFIQAFLMFPLYYFLSVIGAYIGVFTKKYLYISLLKSIQSDLKIPKTELKNLNVNKDKKTLFFELLVIIISIFGIFLIVSGLYNFVQYLQEQHYKKGQFKTEDILKNDQAVFHKKLQLIFAIGGYTRQSKSNVYRETNTVEYYSPRTNSWKSVAPMNTARAFAAAAYANGKIYVFGGSVLNPGDIALKSVEAYSPETNKWENKSPLPVGKTHQSAVTINGKIYLVGGITGSYKKISSVDIYDPITDSWKEGADSPIPFVLDSPSCNGIGKKIYCLKVTSQGYTMVYDTDSNSWSNLASENRSTVNSGVSATIRNTIVSNVFAPSHNYLSIYSANTDSFSTDVVFPVSILDYAVTSIDDYFITLGGDATKGPIKTVRVINTAYPKLWFNLPDMQTSRKDEAVVTTPETQTVRDSGAISGVIFRNTLNNPVPNIHVVLQTTQLFTDQHGKKREEFALHLTNTTTDNTGHYSFLNIPPGKYQVLVENPNQLGDFRAISTPSSPLVQSFTLSKGQRITDYNFDMRVIPSP